MRNHTHILHVDILIWPSKRHCYGLFSKTKLTFRSFGLNRRNVNVKRNADITNFGSLVKFVRFMKIWSGHWKHATIYRFRICNQISTPDFGFISHILCDHDRIRTKHQLCVCNSSIKKKTTWHLSSNHITMELCKRALQTSSKVATVVLMR